MRSRARLARQRGQVILFGLFGVLIGLGALLLMYHAGKLGNEKIRVVDAADAAAYSGGVWTARQLNFAAYTNRVMVVNAMYQGHYTAYVSYVRNIRKVMARLRDALGPIPIVGQVVIGIDEATDVFQYATEFAGIPVIGTLEVSNLLLTANQVAALYGNTQQVSEVMALIGAAHQPEGRAPIVVVGPGGDLATQMPELGALTDQMLRDEAAAIAGFSQIYTPGYDNFRFGQMLGETVLEPTSVSDPAMAGFFKWITTRPHPPGSVSSIQVPTDAISLLQSIASCLVLLELEGCGAAPLSDVTVSGTSTTDFYTYPYAGPYVYWKTTDGGGVGAGNSGVPAEAYSTEFGIFKQAVIGYADVGGLIDQPTASSAGAAPGGTQSLTGSLVDGVRGLQDGSLQALGPARQLTITAIASFAPRSAFDFRDQQKLRTGALPAQLYAASRALVFYQNPDDPSAAAPCEPTPVLGVRRLAPDLDYPDCFATLTNPYWNARLVDGPFVGDLLATAITPPALMPSSTPPPDHQRTGNSGLPAFAP